MGCQTPVGMALQAQPVRGQLRPLQWETAVGTVPRMRTEACPSCYTTTTVDTDSVGVMVVVLLLRLALFSVGGGLVAGAIFGPAVGWIVVIIAGLSQVMGAAGAMSAGATTCHACGTTFATR